MALGENGDAVDVRALEGAGKFPRIELAADTGIKGEV